jgi:hypothetical protein
MACWAACLGDCDNKLSREHLVSDCPFIGDAVRVQGFPWCRDEPMEIGLTALTAKILCVRHNNDLSPVDESAGKAFDTLRQMTLFGNVRSKMKPRIWNVKTFSIDGKTLERWFLKTLINIACDGTYPIGRDSDVPGRASERLVRIAFGHSLFENRAGLYFIAQVGMMMKFEDTVQVLPLIKNDRHIEGALFTFRGISVLLFLESEGPPEPLTGIFLNGEDIGNARLNFHNKEIRGMGGKYLSHLLKIAW